MNDLLHFESLFLCLLSVDPTTTTPCLYYHPPGARGTPLGTLFFLTFGDVALSELRLL